MPLAALILDLSLPDGNGLEFLPELKRNRPATKVIIMTGNRRWTRGNKLLTGKCSERCSPWR